MSILYDDSGGILNPWELTIDGTKFMDVTYVALNRVGCVGWKHLD